MNIIASNDSDKLVVPQHVLNNIKTLLTRLSENENKLNTSLKRISEIILNKFATLQELNDYKLPDGTSYEQTVKDLILETFGKKENDIMKQCNMMQKYERNKSPINIQLMREKKKIQDKVSRRYRQILDLTYPLEKETKE